MRIREHNAFCLLGSTIFFPSACTINKSISQSVFPFVVNRPYEICCIKITFKCLTKTPFKQNAT
ncbi:hypothetical protein HanRHA438_Chr13g0596631 [Helianthus annuus]|nr:hypothetical protein HanRHA438_Chr13g0596631 [Helianthus annuus]